MLLLLQRNLMVIGRFSVTNLFLLVFKFYDILLIQSTIFHYGSISLIEEPCRSAHLAAMETARKAGSILSYDPNLRLPLWPSAEAARKGIMSIWNKADIIKVWKFTHFRSHIKYSLWFVNTHENCNKIFRLARMRSHFWPTAMMLTTTTWC